MFHTAIAGRLRKPAWLAPAPMLWPHKKLNAMRLRIKVQAAPVRPRHVSA